jgi:hypothetical protein
MSYDLTFVPKTADQSWDEAFEAAEAALDDEGAATRRPDDAAWTRIVAKAREVLGDVTDNGGSNWYDLEHDDTGISVSLEATNAGISVPYWYRGEAAERVVRAMYAIGAAVEAATGFAGYDPQVELPLAEAATRVDLAVTAFGEVADSFAERGIGSPSADH